MGLRSLRVTELYKHGYRYEWKLIRSLRLKGLAAVRTAGSGKSGYSPDVLAGFKGNIAAIQVKTTYERTLYISQGDLTSLLGFSSLFGSEPWFYVVFKKFKLAVFAKPETFEKTSRGFKLTLERAKSLGLPLSKFIELLMNK